MHTDMPPEPVASAPRQYTDPQALRFELCSTPFVTAGRLRALLPFGRTKFYELVRHPSFPIPLDVTGDGSVDLVWWSSEVAEHLLCLPRLERTTRPEVAGPRLSNHAIPTVTRRRGARRGSAVTGSESSLTEDGAAIVRPRRSNRRRPA